jgi:hypothetical protein
VGLDFCVAFHGAWLIEVWCNFNPGCVFFAAPQLVAMGTFMNPDTTRIVAKRVILTGHPFKVHKKTATIRYMFFNRGMLSIFSGVVSGTENCI